MKHKLLIPILLVFILITQNSANAQLKTKSPQTVCRFLQEYGIVSIDGNYEYDEYSNEDDIGQYFCASGAIPLKTVENAYFKYYVEGDLHQAKLVELQVNIYSRESVELSHKKLQEIASTLYLKVTGRKISDKIKNAITKSIKSPEGIIAHEEVDNLDISVNKKYYSAHSSGFRFYGITVSFSNKDIKKLKS